MTDMLQQLGGLVLGSVPTMILFLVTLAAYRLLVHTPLTKILRERYERTQGAIEKAAKAIAAAESKTAQYEDRLRAARARVFHRRQELLHAIHVDSEKVLAEAHLVADKHTVAARLSMEESMEKARIQLDASIDGLVADAMRNVLPSRNVSAQEQA